jgi:hypothetical protein
MEFFANLPDTRGLHNALVLMEPKTIIVPIETEEIQ